jgi:hypothetical protein
MTKSIDKYGRQVLGVVVDWAQCLVGWIGWRRGENCAGEQGDRDEFPDGEGWEAKV